MSEKSNSGTASCANKNAHLKGRKRFVADLHDVEEECQENFFSFGLCIKKVRAGEDEGSFEVIIEGEACQQVASVNLLVSDTSEYPSSHTFFCFALDGDIPPKIQDVIEDLANQPSRPIRETLLYLLSRISKALGLCSSQTFGSVNQSDELSDGETEEQSDDGDEDYTMLSDDEPYNIGSFAESSPAHCDMSVLQRDFIETVAADYRPAFIRYSSDNFYVTVSVPILRLTEIIPPRALMAWDRSLLSKTQHLCLLISGFGGVYPVLNPNGTYTSSATNLSAGLQFKVGLTHRYKPGKEEVRMVVQKHGLVLEEAEKAEAETDPLDPLEQLLMLDQPIVFEEEKNDPNRFDHFSLSSSMESLLNQSFLKLVQFRRQFGLGWGGAEKLLAEVEASQSAPQEVLRKFHHEIADAEANETAISERIAFPDPMRGLEKDSVINLPLTAFCYLVRRLAICPQYCLICHRKLDSIYEALKPYVCDSKLCAYQYYALNRGTPLEYEIIHNPQTVDLLLSLAYTAAIEGSLEEPPVGMALRVPFPKGGIVAKANPRRGESSTANQNENMTAPDVEEDGLCDFDQLGLPQMRQAIVTQLDSLPSVYEMRNHLTRKVSSGMMKPKLQDMNPSILPAAWLILRWCVASCTAYIEEITDKNERVRGLGSGWRQFRFSVGSPDAEAKFQHAMEEAQRENARARQYPFLYAFHGSGLRNWHSIIRHGLWFKTIVHGRAYGDGVYLAKDGAVSASSYSSSGQIWPKSMIAATSCVALVEAINLPDKFVSQNPYFVINQTHWILCRYLLVKGRETAELNQSQDQTVVPFVELDNKHPTLMHNKPVQIPDPSHKIKTLLSARRAEYFEEDHDDDDRLVFMHVSEPPRRPSEKRDLSPPPKKKAPVENDWKHDSEYLRAATEHMLPPPEDSSTAASMALQRELRAMLREQESASSLKELGWYMPPEFNEDNLFQWVVELHSFDPDIPIAKDLMARKLNSIVFEIRFPSTFPHSPPFLRILKPRFLPFIRGGGGHVTGGKSTNLMSIEVLTYETGGSICMDLLTADGWSPSYSIPAVLIQIKLAISNLEPRPARLDPSAWNTPYQSREALEGFIRAANAHGWRVPDGLNKLLYC